MGFSNLGHFYLYAVIPGREEKTLGLKGLFDAEVKTIPEGEISAVVSEVSETGKLRPERRHIAAHQAVLSYLVESGNVVLPVSFGTVADSEAGIRKMLSKYQKEFLDQIEKVDGKVEMELRVYLDKPNVFDYYVSKYPELKEMRDRLYASGRTPDREEKLNLGQLFEQIQNSERENQTEKVEKALMPPCVEIKLNRPRNEKEVVRLSCLIEQGEQEKFKSAVEEVSGAFDDDFIFEYSGPVPPYDFVEARVRM